MYEGLAVGAHLTIYDINRPRPLFFEDPVLDDTVKVTHDCRKVKIHVCSSVSLNELIRGRAVQVGLQRDINAYITTVWATTD